MISPPDRLFIGNSEMAQRMREFDWAKTPLGPPESWPQNLKTAVRIMLTSVQAMWIGWGKEARYLYNDPYKSILGGKHPWALGEPAHKVCQEFWDDISAMLAKALRGDEGTYIEAQRLIMERHGFREETFYTYSFSPIADDEGVVGGILCANTDDTRRVLAARRLKTLRDLGGRNLTDAKTAENACQAAARILSENTLDISFGLIYLLDDDNQSARLCGTLEGGGFPGRVDIGGSGDVWDLAHVLQTAQARKIDEAVVVPLARAGVHESPAGFLVAGLSPRVRFDDDYQGFFEMVGDQIATAVSNARSYEQEKKRAEALAELDRAKTAFFSNVSHEFRTPLTLILGPLDDAIAEATEPWQRDRLKLLQRNALRLQKLVNTLLDFSRIEAGRLQASYEPTPLAEFTAELASVFRSTIEKAGMRLVVECAPLAEPVYVDRDMYEKIVLNLLSNAFKFTLEGEIRVGLVDRGSRVELSVTDTGTGIAQEHLPHIFERFHRIEGARSRTHEGTGIGLALIHELVKLHGGSVDVSSVADHGSTFTVILPKGIGHLPADRIGAARLLATTGLSAGHYLEEASRWLPDGADAPTLDDASPVADVYQTNAGGQSRPRIVWADDNADMREYVRRLLGPLCDVEAVPDGETALAVVRRTPPELVLADVMMPRLDGFGLLGALRSDERTRAIPVILLSARAGEENRVEGIAAGADDYLIKPFSARELVARVDAHLKMARLRAASEQALRDNAAALENAVADRDALLKELHHRVKNNLQVVVSLLEMQAGRNGHQATLAALAEARNRVASIASIHELLYRSGSFSSIDVASYARDLMASLVRFYEQEHRIRVLVTGDDVTIDLARAVPLGLLLNEVISNTCKHAFPMDATGHLTLALHHEDGHIHVRVADTGIGLPDRFDLRTSPTLGLQLVQLLAKQLNGTVTFTSQPGTTVDVRLPLDPIP